MPSSKKQPPQAERKKVNLALQGGGAHGAFTWGVLDQILADERLEISAISGTSAGAMNAVLVADGLVHSGEEYARTKLENFWLAVSDATRWSPVSRSPLDIVQGQWSLDKSPGYMWVEWMTSVLTPQQFNPLKINPLRNILERSVDFEAVRSCNKMRVYIAATNVETGRVKVFDRHGLSADHVMASACLPSVFEPVTIDGAHYWDGGFMGNPPLLPLYHEEGCRELIVVQINPITRPGLPKTATDIKNRLNEITFNSSLLKELRAIDFVTRLVEKGDLSRDRYNPMHIHLIEATEELLPLQASSKLNTERAFLLMLRDIGRAAAAKWIDANFDQLGVASTFDVSALFADTGTGYEIVS